MTEPESSEKIIVPGWFRRNRKFIVAGFQIAVSIVILVWLFKLVPPDKWGKFKLLLPWSGILCLILFTIAQLICAFRLYLLLLIQKLQLSLADTVNSTFLGYFISNFLPMTIGGDIVKSVFLMKNSPSDKIKVIPCMLFERVINLATIVLTGCFAGCVQIGNFGWPVYFCVIIALLAGIPLFFYMLAKIKAHQGHNAVMRSISSVMEAMAVFAKSPLAFIYCVSLSFIMLMTVVGGSYLVYEALGIDIGFQKVMIITVAVYIASLVPLSINGLGIQEAGIIGLLAVFGVDAEHGALAALAIRLLAVLAGLWGIVPLIHSKRQAER